MTTIQPHTNNKRIMITFDTNPELEGYNSRFEANISGSGYDRYNAKCRTCHIALNSDELRCYCCSTKLSRRKSLNDNLARKEALIVRID